MAYQGINALFRSTRVAASSARAHRQWLNNISNNLANKDTVDTGKMDKEGNYIPYARQVPIFSKVLSEKFRENRVREDVINGVTVKKTAQLKNEYESVYDPDHPAARRAGSKDAGYVYYPKISIAQEMADLKIAAASYEADITVMAVSNKLFDQALSIGRN
ncbi:MAG: flgC [Chlamydiales bacterium]|jgi:flagellar basal-body rod protein FlgC|nr:flgC [Chlamydiales bacterium]